MIRTDLIKQVEYNDTIYIFGEPFVIEPIEGKQYVVPNDYYNGFKELNPNMDFRAYNYNSHRVTKEPFFDLIDVVLASDTNAPVLSVMFSKGLCAHDNYMTLAEAKAVKNADLVSMFDGNTDITHFEEFQYFTGVTEVAHRMFFNAHNLEKIVLPPTIKIIRDRAFCFPTASLTAGIENKLTYVGGLENVEEIEVNAFQYCYNIKAYNFTQKLKKLGPNCFCGVEHNTTKHGKVTKTESFGDLSGVEVVGDQPFQDIRFSIKELHLPKAAVVCGKAFSHMESLETIEIDWNNFNPDEKEIQIADGSLYSTERMFYSCKKLKRLKSMPLLKKVMDGFCNECWELKYVGDLPNCTSIAQYGFGNCYKLESIGNLDKVTTLGQFAFGACKSLKEINLKSCKSVAQYAFGFEFKGEDCERVVRFGLPYSSITFNKNAFSNSTHTTIYCNGVELTDEQYQAIGATKPIKADVEQPLK